MTKKMTMLSDEGARCFELEKQRVECGLLLIIEERGAYKAIFLFLLDS